MSNVKVGSDPIYDARSIGVPRMLVLGVQHMFAMFGATVLVPALTGLSVSATLLFAGLGTLLFHLITKKKVPAFLGSSFAFLGGYWAIAPNGEPELLPYACVGVACAGLMYAILSGLFKVYGAKKVMRFFPPIVTGPIIICIGMNLSATAINSCSANWGIAAVAIIVVIACNIWGKGMVKIIPILLGVVASYVVGAITGNVDFSKVHEAAWLGLPFNMENTVFSLIGNAHSAGHHDRAYRRRLRHKLHRGAQLPCRPRPAPHPSGRRSCHLHCGPLRRTGEHYLRREYRRAGPLQGI